MNAGNDHFVIIGRVVHDCEFLSGGLTKGIRTFVLPAMPASRHFFPVCISAAVAGGSSGVGKSFIKLDGNLHPSRAVFNRPRRNSRLPLARLKLDPPAGHPGPAGHLGHRVEQVLGFVREKIRQGDLQSAYPGGEGSRERISAHGPERADRP
jgi:hypothetical protein